MKWPWPRQRDAQRQKPENALVKLWRRLGLQEARPDLETVRQAALIDGIRRGIEISIKTIELYADNLPDHAKNSHRHLFGAIVLLRKAGDQIAAGEAEHGQVRR